MLIISLHSGGRKGSRMDHEDVPRRTIKKKDEQASLMHALLGYSVHPVLAQPLWLLLLLFWKNSFSFLIKKLGFIRLEEYQEDSI